MYICMYVYVCKNRSYLISLFRSSVLLSAGMSAGVYVSVWEIGGVGHYPSDLVALTSPFLLRAMTPSDDVIKVKYTIFHIDSLHAYKLTYIKSSYIHTYVHTYIKSCIHTYIFIHSYIFIHTYIHTLIDYFSMDMLGLVLSMKMIPSSHQ